MRWLTAFLRRFVLPAFVGAYLANLAVYWMLESEGGATDWKSVGVLFAIILAGLIVAWPGYVMLRRLRFPALVTGVLLLVLGTGIGALAAWLIAMQLVPDTASDYIRFGLVVGPVAALFWLILNFDVLRPRRAGQFGDRRG
jgi:xanthine/uracil permease